MVHVCTQPIHHGIRDFSCHPHDMRSIGARAGFPPGIMYFDHHLRLKVWQCLCSSQICLQADP